MVEVGNDWFCVVMSASGEDIDVVVVAHVSQELKAIWSHVELELISFTSKLHVGFVVGKDRVDQRLVKVQNKKLLLRI